MRTGLGPILFVAPDVPDVRYWHKADMPAQAIYVRYWG
jgi:hypothetical protein